MSKAHVLILKSAKLPPLYATEKEKDPKVHVKLFAPWGSFTCYLTEYNPETRVAFGLVKNLEEELGYINLNELEGVRGPAGLRIERDLYFKPCALSEARKRS